jgi:hypothetical protein
MVKSRFLAEPVGIRRRSCLFVTPIERIVIAGGGRVVRPPAVTKIPCAISWTLNCYSYYLIVTPDFRLPRFHLSDSFTHVSMYINYSIS